MRRHAAHLFCHAFSVIVFGIFLLLCASASAQEAAAPALPFQVEIPNRTVRAFLYPSDGFHEYKNGKPVGGFGYDYLQHLRQYAPWAYQYSGEDLNWTDGLKMLEEGKIDMLTNVVRTPEREEKFAFSKYPVGQTSTILTVKSGNIKYLMRDYKNWTGMRIGVLNSPMMESHLLKFAEEKGFTYNAVMYPSMNRMIQDLQDGKIDAALSHNLRRIRNEWVVETLNIVPFHLAVRKDDPELLAELDFAMEQLELNDPMLRSEMWEQYFSVEEDDSVQFSEDERNFINAVRSSGIKLKAVLNPDRYPVSYRSFGGEPCGLMKDIADEIIRRTQLPIEFLRVRTPDEYTEACRNSKVDFVFDTKYRLQEGEENGLILSRPYMTLAAFLLKNRSAGNAPKKYVLVEGYRIADAFRERLPADAEIQTCKTTDEAIALVASGQCDAACLYTAAAEAAVRNDTQDRLTATLIPRLQINLSVGTRDTRNPLLSSIMNKAVASLDDEFIFHAMRKYDLSNEDSFSLVRLMHRHPLAVFGIPFVVLLLICVFLVRMLQLRKNSYRLGVVMKNLPLRYSFIDADGNLLQYDYGDSPMPAPGLRNLDDVKDSAIRESFKKLVAKSLETGKPQEALYMDQDRSRVAFTALVSESLFGRPAVIAVSRDVTDLQASRDEAKKNEEYFRQTILGIGDGVIATDQNGNVVMLNPVAERMMGVNFADAAGKPHTEFFKIVGADNDNELESPVLRTLRTGKLVELANHTDLISLDGENRWHISDSSSPIHDADGNVIGAILVFRDVTEEYNRQKQMESEIANWETVAKIAQIYHFVFDPKTARTRGNTQLSDVWPIKDGCAIPAEEWILPDDLSRWNIQYRAVASGAVREAIVNFRVFHSGRMRHFRGFMHGTGRENGEITGMLQETTSYVEAEQRQNATRSMLDACFRNTPLVMFVKSIQDDFRYVQCNENYAEFLGQRMRDIIGRTDAELLCCKEDAAYCHEHDLQVAAAGRPLKLHETVHNSVGQEYLFSTVKFVETWLDGKQVLVCMALDETDAVNRRKKLDDMLEDWENVATVAQIGTYRLDSEMNVLSSTDRMAQFWPLGIDGKPLTAEEYLHPDDAAAYNEMYDSVFNGKLDHASMLCRVPDPDGMRYLRLYVKKNSAQKFSVTGLLQDVTGLIWEQQKREALLSMWNNVVNTLPALFFVKNADDDFRYLQVNDDFCTQTGLKRDQIIGRTEHEILPNQDDAKRNLQEDVFTMTDGGRQNYVEKLHLKSGELRHYQTVKMPSVDENGRRILICMSQDVTEIQAQSESRKIVSSAFETLSSSAFETLFSSENLEEDMKLVLKNICEFIGFERAYIACIDTSENGVRVFSAYRPDGTESLFDLKKFRIEHASTLPWYIKLRDTARNDVYSFDFNDERGREQARFHVPSLLDKKEKFDIRGVHLNYISVKGKPWGCVGFITCGRPVKQLSEPEASLLRLTAHIVELAITRKRVMDQLHAALNSALAADKAKTFFLSSMSHEIRTPLNAVIGFTDLLKDSDLDQETRADFLNSISDASHALLTLLNDILELSKLSSNKVQSVKKMTDMNSFFAEMDAVFRPSASAQQKRLNLIFQTGGVPSLYMDPAHLRQILFNLIGNAIKFTHQGSVTVSMRYTPDSAEKGTLTLSVADTGIGIAQEDRDKMFEPFVQMSRMRGTNASGTGTGLGLAIIKKIVNQEGGTLTLESEIGKGSLFTIELPDVWRHEVDVPEVIQNIAPESVPDFLPDAASAADEAVVPRVLIVDDAEMALEILSRMMTWMHVPHAKASSAMAALDILEKESFDILMTDLIMPGMNGADLAKAVRANPKFAKMRIVAMSTENEAIMYDKSLFDKVMLKPIIRNALYDGIFGKDKK